MLSAVSYIQHNDNQPLEKMTLKISFGSALLYSVWWCPQWFTAENKIYQYSTMVTEFHPIVTFWGGGGLV
jgi:hypothetical protein